MKLSYLFSSSHMARKLTLQGELPTSKELYKNFMIMAWPAMIESILMSFVNIVDTMMVSNCGTNAVAAVGITTQPRMLFYAVFFALSVSVTAIVSRRKGQGDREGANACLSQSLGLVAVLAVGLCGMAVIVAEPLLYFAGANGDTIADAISYFRITMIGLMFTSVGMIINAAQRGTGNTKLSMRTNVVANVTNIIFNAILINGVMNPDTGVWLIPKLGVTGAAIATLIGNIASFCMSLFSILQKNKYLRFDFKGMIHWNAIQLKNLGKVALGASTEQIFMRIGFFVFAKVVAELGTQEVATHTICMNIMLLSFASGDGLSVAASALIGQNLGKNRPDLATLYTKVGQRIGVVISILLAFVFVFFGGYTVALFVTDGDSNTDFVMSVGRILTYFIAVITPAQIIQVIYNGALRGAGDTKYVAVTSMVSIGAVRALLAYLICKFTPAGLYGAWLCLVLDQYVRLVFSAYRFKSGKWTEIQL